MKPLRWEKYKGEKEGMSCNRDRRGKRDQEREREKRREQRAEEDEM